MNVKLTREHKIKVLNSADVYEVKQRILLREKQDRQEQGTHLGGLSLEQRQDTADRADYAGHHEEERSRLHGCLQLRTPEAGIKDNFCPHSFAVSGAQ